MNIRRLIPQDAQAFQSCRLAALQDTPEAFGSSYEEERDNPLSVITRRLGPSETSAIFGAFSGSNLIGIIGLFRECALKLNHKATIGTMYVVPNHRRAGVGNALLAHVIEFASSMQGLRQVNLKVNTVNVAARHLYESVGFQPYGTEPKALLINGTYYDELHMVKVVGRTA